MKCDKIKRLLLLYTGDDLPEATSEKIRIHLARCPDCSCAAATAARSRAVMQEAFAESSENAELKDLWPRVHAVIARDGERRGCRERIGRIVELSFAGALVATALILAGIGLHTGKRANKEVEGYAEETAATGSYELPIVEEVDMEGVTVVTIETDDPEVKIVWFLSD